MTSFRAEKTWVDAGRNGDGSPAVKRHWTIEGPAPFGGLVATCEEQAIEAVAFLNSIPVQAIFYRDTHDNAGRETLEIRGDRTPSRSTISRELGCSFNLGSRVPREQAIDWVRTPRLDRERLAAASPERLPDEKQTLRIMEAVLRDAHARGHIVRVLMPDSSRGRDPITCKPSEFILGRGPDWGAEGIETLEVLA